ncbi:MAG TPA: hypothetical protein VD996_07770 [Chitinophagaceae bacterium]|nr:hypothetical protein [Chitinophagaceae bacterium]
MEDKSNQYNAGSGRQDADRSRDEVLRQNPGLKEQEEKRANKKNEGLFNEDPLEEKRAIEETSEDRLNEAD